MTPVAVTWLPNYCCYISLVKLLACMRKSSCPLLPLLTTKRSLGLASSMNFGFWASCFLKFFYSKIALFSFTYPPSIILPLFMISIWGLLDAALFMNSS